MKGIERLDQLAELEVKIKDCKVPRDKIEKMPIVATYNDGIEYVGEKSSVSPKSHFYSSTRKIIRQEKIIFPLRDHYHGDCEWLGVEAHYLIQESSVKKYWLPSRYYLQFKLKMASEFDKFTSHKIREPVFTSKCFLNCANANLDNVGELLSAIKQFGGISFLYDQRIIGNPHYKRLITSLKTFGFNYDS
jgi:hypothetical protein